MLIGDVPFKGEQLDQDAHLRMCSIAVVPPSQRRPELTIPPALEAVVMKTLAEEGRRSLRWRYAAS